MLGITGDGSLRTETFNVRAILREATEAALSERPAPALWTTELVGPAASIRADRIKLRQAVRNLIANACDAQPTGGAVRIEMVPCSGSVEIVVSDNGPGVPLENVDRICDPFFTTRANGTGLGLALVQRVVELHGGAVELREAPAPLQGASFVLRIPEEPPVNDSNTAPQIHSPTA